MDENALLHAHKILAEGKQWQGRLLPSWELSRLVELAHVYLQRKMNKRSDLHYRLRIVMEISQLWTKESTEKRLEDPVFQRVTSVTSKRLRRQAENIVRLGPVDFIRAAYGNPGAVSGRAAITVSRACHTSAKQLEADILTFHKIMSCDEQLALLQFLGYLDLGKPGAVMTAQTVQKCSPAAYVRFRITAACSKLLVRGLICIAPSSAGLPRAPRYVQCDHM